MKQSAEFKYVNVSNLGFDYFSSRLPRLLHGKTEVEIVNFFLTEELLIELMLTIGKNGFFEGEQLLVVETDKDKYKVIEGNRRLTSVKLLNDYTLATVKKELVKKVYDEAIYKPIVELPCLVFAHEEDIRKYLGFRHITGIKSWGLSEKARYLYGLYKSSFGNQPFKQACYELAKTIGSTRSYVSRVLIAFEIYKYIEDEAYFGIKGLDDTNFYVGYYSDGLSRPNISRFLGVDLDSDKPIEQLNKNNVKLLTKWFYEKFELDGRIQTRLKGRSGDLNGLNNVLGHPLAMKAFVEQGYTLDKATELAEDVDRIFFNSLRSAIMNLENADRITQNLDSFYSGVEEDLIKIRKLTSKIKGVKDEFESKEFDKDEF